MKVPITEKMRQVLADEAARNQLYEFMLSDQREGTIQMSDGRKFNVSYLKPGE